MKLARYGVFSLVAIAVFSSPVSAQEVRKKPRVVGSELARAPSGNQFCENIKDAAQEQRYAIKTRELNQLKAEVEKRIVALEKKRIEFELWRKKRDDFSAKAKAAVVEIYSKMRPDAAAGRLEILDKSLAAAILLKMSAQKAGVILNEMKAEIAAEITQVLASSGNTDIPS